MSKGRYEKQHPQSILWIPLIVIVCIFALLFVFLLKGCDSAPISGAEEVVEKNPDSIAIPGYEALSLKANTKKQDICLPNPAQNVCYFQISLYLEDGTLLWQSELIEPGKASKPIKLSLELEAGTYPNAVLNYACFAMDDNKSPLNGAEMKLTLRVK